MFGAINYGTAVYRNELAKRLHQIGYVTRRTGPAFEIDGVDARLIERFSKRSQFFSRAAFHAAWRNCPRG
jgi:conjugative relaxase-like TrwC/TraI family protein